MKKLTAYFGESDRISDALLDALAERGVHAAALLRGAEGFGFKHHLHTERLLTLSDDLPLVVTAVDEADAIDDALSAVRERFVDGLITVEGIREEPPQSGEAKLTVWCERHGRPTHREVVDQLRAAAADGATVLLGVDGLVHGERRRAGLLRGNRDVPTLVVAVGDAARLAQVRAALDVPIATLEGLRVIRGDDVPPLDADWWRVTAYTSAARPAAARLVRTLRHERAAGATTLHGIWGYHGDAAPHGDRVLALRRHVPAVVEVVDRAPAARRWLALAADDASVVTVEPVPHVEGSLLAARDEG